LKNKFNYIWLPETFDWDDLSVLLNEITNREKGKILKWDKEWKKFVYESMKPIYMK